jgi:hypothetical protein
MRHVCPMGRASAYQGRRSGSMILSWMISCSRAGEAPPPPPPPRPCASTGRSRLRRAPPRARCAPVHSLTCLDVLLILRATRVPRALSSYGGGKTLRELKTHPTHTTHADCDPSAARLALWHRPHDMRMNTATCVRSRLDAQGSHALRPPRLEIKHPYHPSDAAWHGVRERTPCRATSL